MRNCIGYYPWIPKIIPLVYNDALSYLENVYALIEWCNTLKAEIESSYETLGLMIQTAEKNANAYTDKQLKNFRIEFDALKMELDAEIKKLIEDTESAIAELTAELEKKQKEFEEQIDNEIEKLKDFTVEIKEQIDREIADFEKEISDSINRMNHDIVELWTAFNKYRVQVNAYIDFKTEELKGYVDAHTSIRNGNNILVFNPVKAETDTLKRTLDDLYNYLNYGAITAHEYATIGLTAQEYADRGLTAHQYAYEARFFFFEELYLRKFYERLDETIQYLHSELERMESNFFMNSPITGARKLIANVVDELADFHLNTLTAQQYADIGLTAQDYADLGWTAEQYALHSNGYLGKVIGGDISVINIEDTSKDIVNNIMDNLPIMPRARPMMLTITGTDGIAIGTGFVVDSQGTFLLVNGNDVIRMYYNNGTWTTARI